MMERFAKKGALGLVVQLVRTLACHARGRGFEPHPGRHCAAIAQVVECILGKDEVASSNLASSSRRKNVQFFGRFFVLVPLGVEINPRFYRGKKKALA